jgi:hypothetical protein
LARSYLRNPSVKSTSRGPFNKYLATRMGRASRLRDFEPMKVRVTVYVEFRGYGLRGGMLNGDNRIRSTVPAPCIATREPNHGSE